MGNPRDIVIDIIGQDHTDRAFGSVERNIKSLSDKMGTATKATEKAGAAVAGFSSRLAPAAGTIAKVAGATARLGASLAPLGALVAPLVNVVSATAKLGAGLAPLIAFVAPLVAGLKFFKAVMAGLGPAVGAALKSIGDGFKAAQAHAGTLAAKGLPQLAAAFMRLNMPNIARDMDGIAVATNGSMRSFGAWVNSEPGIRLIGTTTGGVRAAFERAAPSITRAAIALLNMGNRANIAGVLRGLGNTVAGLADRFAKWADSITSGNITGALNTVKNAAGALGEKLRMVKDAIVWIGDNPDRIKKMSDAFAGVGVALGLATGGWVSVVVGAVALIANHWDTLKPKFMAAAQWARDAWSAIANDPNVQRIGAAIATIGRAIKDDFVAAWGLLKPKLDEFGGAAKRAWATVGPFVAQVFENPSVRNGIRIMAISIAAVSLAMIALSAVAATVAAGVVGALAAMAAYFVGTFVRSIASAVAFGLNAFGRFAIGLGGVLSRVPGLGAVGRALTNAGNDALGAARKVQGLAASLANVRSKTVTLTLNQVIRRDVTTVDTRRGGGHALGAVGAVVTRPTPAVIGEAGPEMVIPLNRMPGASPLPGGVGGSGGGGMTVVQHFHITQPLGNPRDIATAVINSLVGQSAGGMSMAGLRQAIARAS